MLWPSNGPRSNYVEQFNSVKWFHSKGRWVSQIPASDITKIIFLDYAVYSSADVNWAVCFSWTINNIAKQANPADIDATEMEFGLCDGGEESEYNGVGFVEKL